MVVEEGAKGIGFPVTTYGEASSRCSLTKKSADSAFPQNEEYSCVYSDDAAIPIGAFPPPTATS